jgi:hypothetical protein
MCTFLRESRSRGAHPPIIELRRATGDIAPHDQVPAG